VGGWHCNASPPLLPREGLFQSVNIPHEGKSLGIFRDKNCIPNFPYDVRGPVVANRQSALHDMVFDLAEKK
jgi:hypothetical protein